MSQVFQSLKDLAPIEYKWIDARFSLKDAESGKKKFEIGHVKNAVHWDLNDDLSDLSQSNGRQPMPTKEALIELFQTSGLELDDPILVYDDGGSPFATRAWWFLQYAGFTNASILLEGFEEIKQAGIPITRTATEPKRTAVQPKWNEAIYASREFVEEIVSGKEKEILIDARAENRYKGEHEPLDRIAGHIPTALNFDWEQLRKEGRYVFDESVKDKLAAIVNPHEKVTVYCGSGVTASPLYAMLAHYGYDQVRLYVGSYSDWVSKEDAPVE